MNLQLKMARDRPDQGRLSCSWWTILRSINRLPASSRHTYQAESKVMVYLPQLIITLLSQKVFHLTHYVFFDTRGQMDRVKVSQGSKKEEIPVIIHPINPIKHVSRLPNWFYSLSSYVNF
jgi:hypothetical protein